MKKMHPFKEYAQKTNKKQKGGKLIFFYFVFSFRIPWPDRACETKTFSFPKGIIFKKVYFVSLINYFFDIGLPLKIDNNGNKRNYQCLRGWM